MVGFAATGVSASIGFTWFSLVIGWDFLALTFMAWTWAVVWPYRPDQTASHAEYEWARFGGACDVLRTIHAESA